MQSSICQQHAVDVGVARLEDYLTDIEQMHKPSGDKAPSGDTIMLATPQRCCIRFIIPNNIPLTK